MNDSAFCFIFSLLRKVGLSLIIYHAMLLKFSIAYAGFMNAPH